MLRIRRARLIPRGEAVVAPLYRSRLDLDFRGEGSVDWTLVGDLEKFSLLLLY